MLTALSNKATTKVKVKSKRGKAYENEWLIDHDLITISEALLGHDDVNQPVTWKIFLENAVRHYTGDNGKRAKGEA